MRRSKGWAERRIYAAELGVRRNLSCALNLLVGRNRLWTIRSEVDWFMSNILIQKWVGIVECRICGLMFLPEVEEDRERHEYEHRRIIFGGLPYEVREFMKSAAWDALRGKEVLDEGTRERAKRTLVFAWWMRAVSNGIPENDFQAYMEAQFARLDAEIDDDKEALQRTEGIMDRWQKYGG
jgi:hypothetical protein